MNDLTGNDANRLNERLGVLRLELETLESDMKNAAGDLGAIADNRVHLALRKAEDVAHSAYHLAEDAAGHIARGVDKWASGNLEAARKPIRARPLSALALSLGIGTLIGVLFVRR